MPSTRRRVLLSALVVVLCLIATVAGFAQASPRAGALDPSFGSGGQAITGANEAADNALVIGRDGSVVIGGAIVHSPPGGGNRSDFAVLRYRSDGHLDSRFGSGGVVVTSILDQSQVAALALQRNGDIVAAGVAYARSTPELALARFLPNGALDQGFGRGGVVTTTVDGGSFAQGVVVQANGRIVVTGRAADPAHNYRDVLALVRFLPNGALDPSFGSHGIVTNADAQQAAAIAVDARGRIVLAGDSRIFRYTAAGQPDPSFHGNGESTPFSVGPPAALALAPGGAIEVTGEDQNSPYLMYAARYTAAGARDPHFGTNGVVSVPPLAASTPLHTPTAWADAIVVEGTGKTVLAGWNDDGTSQLCGGFELVRLLRDGRLDASFGSGGRALVKTANCIGGSPRALSRDARGHLVVTGPATARGTGWFVTMRFLG